MQGVRTRGQPVALGALTAMIRGRAPHAVLLVGPAGVGKTTLALDLAAGLLCTAPEELTNDAKLAQRIDEIAFPGLTANFDVSKSAALAVTLLDWKTFGTEYAAKMVATAAALADALAAEGLPVFKTAKGFTQSHQLAVEAHRFGGGQAASKTLRRANMLACGIGLPLPEIDGDLNGLRLGTNELVRWGMGPEHAGELARLIARALVGNEGPEAIAPQATALRRKLDRMHFVR